MKKTMVLGASNNPTRYSFAAVRRLKEQGFEVVPVSNKTGEVDGIPILNGRPEVDDVHTVTLYMNAKRLEEYIDYIISLKPKRIIFNPGTENVNLINRAKESGIEPVVACNLVMLATGQY